MAPRKKTTKVAKEGKPPAKEKIPTYSSSQEMRRTEQSAEYRSLRTRDELRDVMGAESDDSLSNSENDSFHSNKNQSRPNFSFLPSHKHSSPKRTNVAASVHRLASMPTVPNTDREETASTTASTPRRNSPREASRSTSKTTRNEAQPTSSKQPHSRKQTKPHQLKLLKEIIHLQNTVHMLIPKMSFARVIREILAEYTSRSIRVTPDMLVCLHEAAEIYVIQLFEDAYRCTLHRNRVTLLPKDMQLASMLRRI
ncbi:uncharacterized protein LOC128712311 [Anopheles marshallii]|uniref:uncharacterized protein LOC128712311 n=1 Tax=Anopheles marshallii TaxID=1521116 RepID=UPI00237ABCA2|nr:uncharacterized protein LOC128712311 [Anopheles marshallii]